MFTEPCNLCVLSFPPPNTTPEEVLHFLFVYSTQSNLLGPMTHMLAECQGGYGMHVPSQLCAREAYLEKEKGGREGS